MIGIDLLTQGDHARWTIEERPDGSCTLSQREIGSAVQETPRLVMARRDRHPHHDTLTAGLDQLDLQRLIQALHWGYVVHLTSFRAHSSSSVAVYCAGARWGLASVAASADSLPSSSPPLSLVVRRRQQCPCPRLCTAWPARSAAAGAPVPATA